jgi:PAS domain S-box-containing protein
MDAIIMMDNNGSISYWNPAAERLFGYSPEEALGRELHPLLAPSKYLPASSEGLSSFKTTGQGAAVGRTLEVSAIRRDGTEFPVELSISRVQIAGIWHAVGVVRDISDRKAAEEALRDQARRDPLTGVLNHRAIVEKIRD